jgi:hypothetical protein
MAASADEIEMSGAGFVAICLKAHDRQRSERAFGNSLSRDGPGNRALLPLGAMRRSANWAECPRP